MDKMKNQPEISIIIPIYNSERFIDRCLYSVLNQSFSDFEVILVDDGSTDSSPVLCDAYALKDNRIKVFHRQNGGASAARNFGLSVASGRYISFVDSDDYIHKELLYRLYNKMHDGIDFVSCSMEIVKDIDLKKFELQIKSSSVELNQNQLYQRFFRVNGEDSSIYSVCGRLYSRKSLNEFKLIEGRMNEDIDGVFQIISHSEKAIFLSDVMYFYYKNVEGVTNSRITRKKLDLIFIWAQLKTKVETCCPDYIDAWKMNALRANFTILSQCKINGYDKSDTELRKSLQEMQRLVRAEKRDLLKWKMPLSRKVLLLLICYVWRY